MKNSIYLLLLILLIACDSNNNLGNKVVVKNESGPKTTKFSHPIVGKWKIYKTNIGGKDISKSADPGDENGIEFNEDENYLSFGNPGHKDNGTYKLTNEGKSIQLSSEKGNNATVANFDLEGDSLQMKFTLPNKSLLLMELYRMSD